MTFGGRYAGDVESTSYHGEEHGHRREAYRRRIGMPTLADEFRSHMPPGGAPLVLLYAADLDALRQRIDAAGVQTFNEHTFPGGRRFHFKDPGGNEIAVWSEK